MTNECYSCKTTTKRLCWYFFPATADEGWYCLHCADALHDQLEAQGATRDPQAEKESP